MLTDRMQTEGTDRPAKPQPTASHRQNSRKYNPVLPADGLKIKQVILLEEGEAGKHPRGLNDWVELHMPPHDHRREGETEGGSRGSHVHRVPPRRPPPESEPVELR